MRVLGIILLVDRLGMGGLSSLQGTYECIFPVEVSHFIVND